MIWLTSFAFPLLLILSQHGCAESKSNFGGPSKSPWADPTKANIFMGCLIQEIATSSDFPQQEKEDLESIVATMMSAITSMSAQAQAGHGNTKAQLQAMNMAFASSMAELVIAEDIGNMKSILIKTEALSKALSKCFMATMGSVNKLFINEIKDLIKMFAKEAADIGEDNEIEDSEIYGYPTSGYGTTSVSTVSTSAGGIRSGTSISGPGFGGPEGPSPDSVVSIFIQNLSSTLSSSNAFQNAVRSGLPASKLANFFSSVAQSGMNTVGIGYAVAQEMSSAIQSSISSLGGQASDISTVTRAIGKGAAKGLQSSGTLTSSNAESLAKKVGQAIINAIPSVAPQYGIDISRTGAVSSTTTVSTVTTVSGFGSQLVSSLTEKLASALSQCSLFKTVFKSGISSSTATQISSMSVQFASSVIGLDYSTSLQIKSAVESTVGSVPQGSGTESYAKAIATAVSPIIAARGKLTPENIGDTARQIVDGILKGVQSVAPQFGINVSGSDVASDIKRVSSIFKTTVTTTTVKSQGSTFPSFPSTFGVQQGPGAGSPTDSFIRELSSVLSGSNVFNSIVSSGVAPQTMGSVFQSAIRTGMPSAGIDYQSTEGMSNKVQNNVSGLGGRSKESSAVLDAVTRGMAEVLVSSGTLTSSNGPELAQRVGGALRTGMNSVVSQFGITVTVSTSGGPQGPGPFGPQGPGAQGPGGPGGPSSTFVQKMSSILSNSNVFRAVVSSGIGAQNLVVLVTSCIQNGLPTKGIDFPSTQGISSNVQTTLSSLGGQSSDMPAVANAVSTGAAQALLTSGRLTSSTSDSLAQQVAQGILEQMTSLAPQYGIDLSGVSTVSSSTTISSVTTSVSSFGGAQGPKGPGAGSPTDSFIRELSSVLSGSNVFNSIVSSGVAPQTMGSVFQSAIRTGMPSAGIDYQSTEGMSNKVQNNVSGLGGRSKESSAVLDAVTRGIAEVLVSSGTLTSSNGPELAQRVGGALRTGMKSVVSQFGITVTVSTSGGPQGPGPFGPQGPGAQGPGGLGGPSATFVQKMSSILSNSNAFRAVVNSGISAQNRVVLFTSCIQSGLPTVGIDSPSTQRISSNVQATLSALGGQSSDMSAVANAVSTGAAQALLDSGKLNSSNADNLALEVVKGIVITLTSLAPQYGIVISPAVGVSSSTSVIASTSGSPAEQISSLTQQVSSALSASRTFNLVFNSNVSPLVAAQISSLSAQYLSSVLNLDFAISTQIKTIVEPSVRALPQGSSSSSYAQTIATSVIPLIASSGLLKTGNPGDVARQFVDGFLQGIKSAAPQFGFNVSGVNVGSEVSSLSSFFTSTVTTTTSTSTTESASTSVSAGPGPSVTGDSTSTFVERISSTLSSSSAMQSIITAGLNSQSLSNLLLSAIQSGIMSAGIDSFSAQGMATNVQSFISSLGLQVSNLSRVVEAIGKGSAKGLLSTGALTSSNAKKLADLVADGIISALPSVAAQYGIIISGSAAMPSSGATGFGGPGAPGFGGPGGPGFGGPGGSGFGGQGAPGFGGPGGAGMGPSANVASILSSPTGLTSAEAASRITDLSLALAGAIRPDGLDMNSLGRGIESMIPQIRSSGLSPTEVIIEALMEVLVALIQMLSSSQGGSVNTSSTVATSNSVAAVFSSILS